MKLLKIVSGGQTGADRAALDAAIACGFPIGGWVPKGRKAEDGVIPARYPGLQETDTDAYEIRTRWNVRDSDATLILSHGPLTGGSLFTEEIAHELGRPVLHVDLDVTPVSDAVTAIRAWLDTVDGDTLNVAGPRASKDSTIYDRTKETIIRLIHSFTFQKP